MKKTKKGFTLVELLVVIAILAILATVSVVGYTSFINKANESVALQELTQIKNYMIADDFDNEEYSITSTDGLKFKDNSSTTFETIKSELGLKGNLTQTGENVTYIPENSTASAVWNTKTGEIKAGSGS